MKVRSITALIWLNRYIWTKFGTRHNTTLSTRRMAISRNLKIQNGGRRHLGISCHVKRKMSNSGLDKDYMHQILQDNALDICLYNSLYYRTSYDHGLYVSTRAFRFIKKYSDSIRFSETNRFCWIWFDLAHHCRIGVYRLLSLTMLSNVNILLFTTLEQTC